MAERAGADVIINYTTEDLVARVREATTGRGVDVVFEVVGGPVFGQAARCAAELGRIVVFGFASGEIPSFRANHALLKNYSLVGANFGSLAIGRNHPLARESLDRIAAWTAAEKLTPPVLEPTPFELADRAMRQLLYAKEQLPKAIVLG
jgi:NADPH2:quinone reductase